MSEEPINPFYIYDDADKKYLKDSLRAKVAEWYRYDNWADRVAKEIDYIQKKLEEKNG